ncbi:hypothetical protein PM082_012496 [Marasmius tenuissimus]|nr:hypothetical protein PM082_012496 [Marasmius tenuissimus]
MPHLAQIPSSTSGVWEPPQPTATIVLTSFCADNFYYCHLSQFTKPFIASCAAFLLYGTTLIHGLMIIPYFWPGVYAVLFVICIWVLIRRKRERFRVHCLLITTLFSLATASLAMNTAVSLLTDELNGLRSGVGAVTWSFQGIPRESWPPIAVDADFHRSLPSEEREKELNLVTGDIKAALQVMTIASNIITDIILLWRCHLIWGGRVSVVVPPMLLCLANNGTFCPSCLKVSETNDASVIGILTLTPYQHGRKIDFDYGMSTVELGQPFSNTSDHDKFLISFAFGSFCTNILLTGLIAGRIFYISYTVTRISAQRVSNMYKTIIHACLESGLLYPFNLLLYAAFLFGAAGRQSDRPETTSKVILETFLKMFYTIEIMVMGIASSLIIVRSALGIAIHDETSFRATVMGERWAVAPVETSGAQMNSVINVRSIISPSARSVEESGMREKKRSQIEQSSMT